jgi:hypothetical protein
MDGAGFLEGVAEVPSPASTPKTPSRLVPSFARSAKDKASTSQDFPTACAEVIARRLIGQRVSLPLNADAAAEAEAAAALHQEAYLKDNRGLGSYTPAVPPGRRRSGAMQGGVVTDFISHGEAGAAVWASCVSIALDSRARTPAAASSSGTGAKGVCLAPHLCHPPPSGSTTASPAGGRSSAAAAAPPPRATNSQSSAKQSARSRPPLPTPRRRASTTYIDGGLFDDWGDVATKVDPMAEAIAAAAAEAAAEEAEEAEEEARRRGAAKRGPRTPSGGDKKRAPTRRGDNTASALSRQAKG